MDSLIQLAPFALIIGIMYFLLWRPQQQEAARQQELQQGLAKGDEIVLKSGIYGKVVAVGNDTVDVETAPKVRMTVEKSMVFRRQGETVEQA